MVCTLEFVLEKTKPNQLGVKGIRLTYCTVCNL